MSEKPDLSKKNNAIGLVSNIQHFSIQDGPGIRTTVFLKGCPLKCMWCSNPETWTPYPEIMIEGRKCAQSKTCIDICPLQCINFNAAKNIPEIDRSKCDRCMACVEACPAKALKIVGQYMHVDEIMADILKDELFYRNSGGGVTLSGGEALFQKKFAVLLLKECKKQHLHTAIDTSGYADWQVLENALKYLDLVLLDIKHMDSSKHKELTGAENKKILENAKRIAESTMVWVRIPVVTGFNDDRANILRTAEFALQIGAEKLSLLGYHELGKIKYEGLNRPYPLPVKDIKPIKKDDLQTLKELIETNIPALNITIGY